MNVNVKVRGPLFDKKIDATVRAAIFDEGLAKISQRMTRNGPFGSGGKGLGVKRNTVGAAMSWPSSSATGDLTVETTTVWPRTKGTKWAEKNMRIVRAMAPRVMAAVGRRIVGELG